MGDRAGAGAVDGRAGGAGRMGGRMGKRRWTVAVVLAAALVVPTGGAAQARHVCGLDDPTLNQACESHPESNLLQKIVCLILPTC